MFMGGWCWQLCGARFYAQGRSGKKGAARALRFSWCIHGWVCVVVACVLRGQRAPAWVCKKWISVRGWCAAGAADIVPPRRAHGWLEALQSAKRSRSEAMGSPSPLLSAWQ